MKRQHDMCQCKHPYGYHNTGGRCCGGIVNQCECKSFVSKTESIEIVWGTRSQLEDLCMERDRYKAALERIAENGTHHDLTPTKKMWGADRKPLDEANEIWWHAWIKRMDEQVKTIAREALKGAGK